MNHQFTLNCSDESTSNDNSTNCIEESLSDDESDVGLILEATVIPTQVVQVVHEKNHDTKIESHGNKWFDVAVGIKHGNEKSGLTKEEEDMINKSSRLKKSYDNALIKNEERFFETLKENSESSLQELLEYDSNGL